MRKSLAIMVSQSCGTISSSGSDARDENDDAARGVEAGDEEGSAGERADRDRDQDARGADELLGTRPQRRHARHAEVGLVQERGAEERGEETERDDEKDRRRRRRRRGEEGEGSHGERHLTEPRQDRGHADHADELADHASRGARRRRTTPALMSQAIVGRSPIAKTMSPVAVDRKSSTISMVASVVADETMPKTPIQRGKRGSPSIAEPKRIATAMRSATLSRFRRCA